MIFWFVFLPLILAFPYETRFAFFSVSAESAVARCIRGAIPIWRVG